MSITSLQSKHSKTPSIIAAIICIALTLWSVLWFWSAVITVRPEAVITQWEQSNTEHIDQALALKMITRLERSITINPLDANSHLLMARYYEALTTTELINASNSKSNNYSTLAELEYKLATKHQASWDYAWARQAKLYSDRPVLNQDNFIHALSKVMLFGPYERKTQQVIVPLIFKHWPLLISNKQALDQATKIIKHALKYHTNALLTLNSAKKYHRLKELAPLLTKKWHKNRLNKYLRDAANE